MPPGTPSSRVLSPSCSILLDVVRFAAALLVLYAHFSATAMTVGLRNGNGAGNLAVSVFFVLSGFVIRMVTVSGRGSARDYLIDRTSRVYSGVLPCLVLSFALAAIASYVNPARFAQEVHTFHPGRVPLEFLANVTFTSQLWGYTISPIGNGPFWSISFEVLYYAIYGLVFYRIRHHWLWVAGLLLVAGPSMIFNAPFWLMGCLVYDIFTRIEDDRRAPLYTSAALVGLAGVLFAVRHPMIRMIEAAGHAERMNWITRLVPSHALLFRGQIPWFSRISISYIPATIFTSVFLLWALVLLQRFMPDAPERVVKIVRLVGNSTFALYLLHVPIFVLVSAVLGHPIRTRLFEVILPTSIVILCIFLSVPFDLFRRWLRKALGKPRGKPQPSEGVLA